MYNDMVTRISRLPDGGAIYKTAEGLLIRVPAHVAVEEKLPASRVGNYVSEAMALLENACAMARLVC